MMPRLSSVSGHRLADLLEDLIQVPDALDVAIVGLALDSRRVQPGDLFLAVTGHQVHGVDFAADALAAGAAAIAWEPSPTVDCVPAALHDAGIPIFAIDRLGQQAGLIANRFYGRPSHDMFTVGITGTDGKTSCCHTIAQALNQVCGGCGLIGTLGYGAYGALRSGIHTTPDALTLQEELALIHDSDAPCAVIEVSSHALVQGRVAGVAFDVAVLTNLSRDHLDYHGNVEAYGESKRNLFFMPGLRHAVLNADDSFGRALVSQLQTGVEIIRYSQNPDQIAALSAAGGHWIVAENVHADVTGLHMKIRSNWGDGELACRLLGRFNVSNLLAALGVLLVKNVPLEAALGLIAETQTVAGRMEAFGGKTQQPLVVVDYAHTPRALEQVLLALREHCEGQLWSVFGAGGERDRGKRPLMGAAAERLADHVVITDDNPRHEDATQIVMEILSGMQNPDRAYVVRDRGQAIATALANSGPDDVILVAGKGHEAYQQIGDTRRSYSDRKQVQALLGEISE